MATISRLRKSKSTLSHANNSNVEDQTPLPTASSTQTSSPAGFLFHLSNIKNRRKSRIDLSTAVESQQSIIAREQRQQQQGHNQHSITQLRRRLVHKASTFNLHSRHRISPETSRQALQRSEHLFPDSSTSADIEHAARAELSTSTSTLKSESVRPSTPSTVYSEAAETILHRSPSLAKHTSQESHITAIQARRHTVPDPYKIESENIHSSWSQQSSFDRSDTQLTLLQAQAELTALQPGYKEKHIDRLGVWVKMANATAQPPLPYEKLKEITVEACDSALRNTTSYEHTKTEGWNTSIINEILSRLVGESTPDTANGVASTQQNQPQWKFVVNSTIIQHRGSDDSKPARRGMHAAAGAYWNNEKDGMWSFKYEAAERMGLDVIVGIVWVWV